MSDPRHSPDWRWWRAETVIRDDYQCQDCGVRGGRKGDAKLHAHHETPVGEGGDTSLENLVTLCADCHHERHYGPEVEFDPIPEDEWDVPCPECGELFPTENNLRPHTVIEHDTRLEELR